MNKVNFLTINFNFNFLIVNPNPVKLTENVIIAERLRL